MRPIIFLPGLALAVVGLVIGFSPVSRSETPKGSEQPEKPPYMATSLKSFEGIEEPAVRYIPSSDTFESDTFPNITDAGDGIVRMALRFSKDGWDGDRTTKNKDRQRAEVKGIGAHQKDGETFEYATTWRTDPDFKGGSKFCHVFQLKATDGDNGAPLVTLSILSGENSAAVRFWPGNSNNFLVARKFPWKPNTWQNVRIRIKTSKTPDGAIQVSVDGDPFQGVKDVAVYRPNSEDYRPKWGLYRGVAKDLPLHDDWVEHKDASAHKL